MKYIGLLLIYISVVLGAQAPQAALVKTAPIVEGETAIFQQYVGTLYYDRSSKLASESSGIVEKIYLKEGQYAKKGDLLLHLESSILEANIKAQEATLDAKIAEQTKQKRDLARSKALLERKSISQSGYDTTFYSLEKLNAEIEAQRAKLYAMQIELEKKKIRAPFSGIVVIRNVEVGEWVAVGSSVATFVDPKSLEVRVNVPSKLLNTFVKDQSLDASIDDENVAVKVKNIIPLADKTTRTFPVELTIESKTNLIEGMRIDVKVPTRAKTKALFVPRDAVIKRFGNFVVFSVTDGKAMMNPVEVISYTGNQAIIASPMLRPGIKVVVKGNERIFPNMPVQEKGE